MDTIADEKYIPRAIEPFVLRCSSAFKAILVTGPRQVGKTTMLRHLIEAESTFQGVESRHYVNLDVNADRRLAKEDPELFLQRHKPPVLIDEIQQAPEILPTLKAYLDEHPAHGAVWLTGSQPFELMKNVSESLAGRVAVIELMGLSQAEIEGRSNEAFEPSETYFLNRTATVRPHDVGEVFESIARGGFPGIRGLDADLRAVAFESLIDTYMLRDIRSLGRIEDELRFRRFIEVCASLTARPVVYAELARLCDIDEKTARSWLSLLTGSYLVKLVKPFANNRLKRLSKRPLMHFSDTGLAAYLAGWESPTTLERGAMSGQIFETYCHNEIAKSWVNAGRRPTLYFFRSNDRREIDLLLERENTIFPVEIKKGANPSSVDVKSFRSLEPLQSKEGASADTVDALAQDDAIFENAAASAAGGDPRAVDELSDNGAISASADPSAREIGVGTVVCLAQDTRPITPSAWSFPIWAV